MIQAGSWQETFALTAKLTQTFTHQVRNSLGALQGRRPLSPLEHKIWLSALTGLTLFIINGRLMLAILAGLGSFKLLDWLNQRDLIPAARLFQPSPNAVKPSLTLTPISMAGLSIVSAMGVYMAASIMAEAENYWLATGHILQGFFTVAIFCLLICRMSQPGLDPSPQSSDLEQVLNDLTHPNPLKRLIAVRQVTHLATQPQLKQLDLDATHLSPRSHVTDCFRLMLQQEPEAIIRAAIRKSLQLLNPKPESVSPNSQLPTGTPPLAGPMALNRSQGQVRSSHPIQPRQVEYVEP
ncbi:MAG: hypothetical protein QNJ46_00150 [Leptolyngbyaceae cyanobacterium MO_188.B28]|nr:hypothetical protein [Leptolyngbyaceae cyanobacterium MO_188.B28]